MNAKELASQMDGRGIGDEITNEEVAGAREDGLIAIFGASDDLMEFRGALCEEIGACDGTTAYIHIDGWLVEEPECKCEHAREWFNDNKAEAHPVEALWCPGGVEGDPSWIFKSEHLAYETFSIYERDYQRGEDGEQPVGSLYCIGIVIDKEDLVGTPPSGE